MPCKHIWRLGATMGTRVLLVRKLNFYFLLSISKNRSRNFSFEEEFFIVLVKLETSMKTWHKHFDTSAAHISIIFGYRFDPPIRQHSFMEIGHEIIFYGHSLPTADSRRAVVRYWWKDVHLLLVKRLGLSLPRIKCGYQIASMKSNSSRLEPVAI